MPLVVSSDKKATYCSVCLSFKSVTVRGLVWYTLLNLYFRLVMENPYIVWH